MTRFASSMIVATLALTLGTSADAEAQRIRHPLLFEGTGGVVIPTNTFADATNLGVGFSSSLGYALNPKFLLLGNFNLGLHSGSTGSFDWSTYSAFGMVGFSLSPPRSQSQLIIPVGVGIMGFNPDAASVSTETYFAATTGAKLYYYFAEQIGLALSAMVQVAFSDEQELGSSTTWLIPLGGGIVFRF